MMKLKLQKNATSNQNRKEQKRREAELRQQTAPFVKNCSVGRQNG